MQLDSKKTAVLVLTIGLVISAGAYAYARVNADIYRMPVAAMEPTIMSGETFQIDRSAYESADPLRWDLVVFDSPQVEGKTWVFRVVGLPGETVSFGPDGVLIDGKPVEVPVDLRTIPYGAAKLDIATAESPFAIPKRSYYVLGDNPSKANDSRFWGAVNGESILGRVDR